jgi:MFS family permease
MIIEPRALPPATDPEHGRSRVSEAIDLEHPSNYQSVSSELSVPISRVSHSGKPSDRRPRIFELWKSSRFSFAVVATICLATAVTSFDGALPIYVNGLFAFISTQTGLLYLAVAVATFIQPLVGHWIDKHGGRLIGATRFLLSCPAFVCLRFVDHDFTGHKVLLVLPLVIIGALMSASIPVYMAEVSCVVLDIGKSDSSTPNSRCAFAQAHSLWSAGYNIGCTLGPSWGGWIQQRAG